MCEEKQEELEKLKDKLDDTENEMKNLKSYLYARFGTSINLEEEWIDTYLRAVFNLLIHLKLP